MEPTLPITKQCSKCKKVLALEFFPFKGLIGHRKMNGKLLSRCNNCIKSQREKEKSRRKEYRKKYQQTEKYKEKQAEYRILSTYGIGKHEKELLLNYQGNKCAVCGTIKPNKLGWVIDHDHFTNKVRGILCGNCNAALGLLKDSRQILQAADAYLAKYEQED